MDTNKSIVGWIGTYLPPSIAMAITSGNEVSLLAYFCIGAIAGMASILAYYYL